SETSDSESRKTGLRLRFVRFRSATGARRTNSRPEQSLIWRSPGNNRLPRVRRTHDVIVILISEAKHQACPLVHFARDGFEFDVQGQVFITRFVYDGQRETRSE